MDYLTAFHFSLIYVVSVFVEDQHGFEFDCFDVVFTLLVYSLLHLDKNLVERSFCSGSKWLCLFDRADLVLTWHTLYSMQGVHLLDLCQDKNSPPFMWKLASRILKSCRAISGCGGLTA